MEINMEKKSHNLRALRGDTTYDDFQFQQDMKEDGINIPDNLLYTPEMNQYVASEYKAYNIKALQNEVNPITGQKFTEKEATDEANTSYQKTLDTIKKLS